MKFKVTGVHRETGARMVLDLDATNRVQAERTANHAGMGEVLHCEQVHDTRDPVIERKSHRGEFERRGNGGLILWLVVAIVLAVGAYQLYSRFIANQ